MGAVATYFLYVRGKLTRHLAGTTSNLGAAALMWHGCHTRRLVASTPGVRTRQKSKARLRWPQTKPTTKNRKGCFETPSSGGASSMSRAHEKLPPGYDAGAHLYSCRFWTRFSGQGGVRFGHALGGAGIVRQSVLASAPQVAPATSQYDTFIGCHVRCESMAA